MISFPHAKINLGLSIVSKRPDGFHNLETIFYPLPIHDILEIIPSENTNFISTGSTIPGDNEKNLVLRAYKKIKEKYPRTGASEIHLHKAIPIGAGLGGGSSDAAETISMIDHLFNLQIPRDELMKFALDLGSDCPFFMQTLPCFASGRGEIFEPLNLDLSEYSFLLVHPVIKIDTAWAFSKINPDGTRTRDLKKCISQPIETWTGNLFNDFEIPVFRKYPALQEIKEKLYSAGALYASMTGSGSTIFGIFPKNSLPDIIISNARQTKID